MCKSCDTLPGRKLLEDYWLAVRNNMNLITLGIEKDLDCSSVFNSSGWKLGMSLELEHSRKKNSLENWRDYGGSLDRFDRNNWRRRGLYEDLSNATKCGISQVC